MRRAERGPVHEGYEPGDPEAEALAARLRAGELEQDVPDWAFTVQEPAHLSFLDVLLELSRFYPAYTVDGLLELPVRRVWLMIEHMAEHRAQMAEAARENPMAALALSATALLAVYLRLRETEAAFALWALPNPIDPRGLLSFGITGLGVGLLAWLMVHGGPFSPRLGYLEFVSALLLLILYLGRLIVLDATSPIVVVPAVLSGVVANPAWYIWLGPELWRGRLCARSSLHLFPLCRARHDPL